MLFLEPAPRYPPEEDTRHQAWSVVIVHVVPTSLLFLMVKLLSDGARRPRVEENARDAGESVMLVLAGGGGGGGVGAGGGGVGVVAVTVYT